MKLKFRIAIFLLFTALGQSFAQYTDVINSNRPGVSQSAFAVGQRVLQLETGGYGIREVHQLRRYQANGFGGSVALRYGFYLDQLELMAEADYRMDLLQAPLIQEWRSGLQISRIGAKYLVFDPNKNYEEVTNIYSWKENQKFKWRQLIPAVAVYAGANFNLNNPFTFATDPTVSPRLVLITQNLIGTKWVVVSNAFADRIGTDFPTYGGVLTVTRGIHYRLSVFMEMQGFISDFYSDGIISGGAAYLVSENIQMDIHLNKNVKDTPSLLYGGVGMCWRWDHRYKPRLFPLKTEKEKQDALKKKDQKEKTELELFEEKQNKKSRRKRGKDAEIIDDIDDDDIPRMNERPVKEDNTDETDDE